MAKYNAIEVYEKIWSKRVLPLFNYADTEVCKSVMRVCYNSGIRVFELTNRDALAFAVFKELVPYVERELPGLSLGAGTILDGDTARRYIDVGADFIIAPNLDIAVGKVCMENSIPWIPGCFTPSEMKTAYDLGAEVIKLFPAGSVGPSYVKHIKGPFPFMKIIVTGGVELDEVSLAKWIEAGVFAVGVGSQLFNENNIKTGNYTGIENQISYIIQFTAMKEER